MKKSSPEKNGSNSPLEVLSRRDRKIPAYKIGERHLQIGLGLIPASTDYTLYNVSPETFQELLSKRFSLRNSPRLSEISGQRTLAANGLNVEVGDIAAKGKSILLYPKLSSFQMMRVPEETLKGSHFLLEFGDSGAFVLLGRDRIQKRPGSNLYYTFRSDPLMRIQSKPGQNIFISSTRNFENLLGLNAHYDIEKLSGMISEMAGSLSEWKQLAGQMGSDANDLPAATGSLIGSILTFIDILTSQELTQLEFDDYIQSLRSSYPRYYALLAKSTIRNRPDEDTGETNLPSGREDIGIANNSVAKQSNGARNTLAATATSKAASATAQKRPLIKYSEILLPKEAGIIKGASVTPACAASYIEHPYQRSELLAEVGCDGGLNLEFDAGPLTLILSSTASDSEGISPHLWGVTGLSYSSYAKISSDRQFYIEAYSKRQLKPLGANGLAEVIPFWGEEHRFTILNAKTIRVESGRYVKEFTRLTSTNSDDYFFKRLLDRNGDIIAEYDYSPETLDLRKVSFRANLSSNQLVQIFLTPNADGVEITANYPEFTPVSVSISDGKLLSVQQDGDFVSLTWRSGEKSRWLPVAIQKTAISDIKGESGKNVTRKTEFDYAKYFGLTPKGQVLFAAEGKLSSGAALNSETIKYQSSNTHKFITKNDSFGRESYVAFKPFGRYMLTAYFEKYDGLGIESFRYGDAAKHFPLDKVWHPAYGWTYDLKSSTATATSKVESFSTHSGSEEHSTTRSEDKTIYTSKYLDTQGTELRILKVTEDYKQNLTKYDLTEGQKRTEVTETASGSRKVVFFKGKIVEDVKQTRQLNRVKYEDILNGKYYQKLVEGTGDNSKTTEQIFIPGRSQYLFESEMEKLGSVWRQTEKVFAAGTLQAVSKSSVGKTSAQSDISIPIAGSAHWQRKISGITGTSGTPSGSVAITGVPVVGAP